MEKLKSEIREIEGYIVSATVSEHDVEFEILDNCSQECGGGNVKWDGCSNWNLNVHFCARTHTTDFGNLLSELYVWAAKLLPEHSDWILN